MAQLTSTLSYPVFKVRRHHRELLTPSRPTPNEVKPLSDIDDQTVLRFQLPFIFFYRGDIAFKERDVAKVIREALRDALVYYYPLAGRLREGPERKLAVECNGEGIIFIEAEADVSLEELGDNLLPPFPFLDELLHDVPGSAGITDSPLLLIQVTRLRCGGFVFALRQNHTLCDGEGVAQFLTAVGEIARGASEPSVPPVWCRDLLNARSPPRVTCLHREYEEVGDMTFGFPMDDMASQSFFFGEDELQSLRSQLPDDLKGSTTYEIVTACLWKCRIAATSSDSGEEFRLSCVVNVRSRFPLPAGYYGNAITHPVAVATGKELCSRPLEYAVELVRKAKYSVNEEYVRSVADLMVTRGRPLLTLSRSYSVSDVRHLGFSEVDFGAGKAVFGGPVLDMMIGSIATFFYPFTTTAGKKGNVVSIRLPISAMAQFVEELKNMLSQKPQ